MAGRSAELRLVGLMLKVKLLSEREPTELVLERGSTELNLVAWSSAEVELMLG